MSPASRSRVSGIPLVEEDDEFERLLVAGAGGDRGLEIVHDSRCPGTAANPAHLLRSQSWRFQKRERIDSEADRGAGPKFWVVWPFLEPLVTRLAPCTGFRPIVSLRFGQLNPDG